MLSGDSSGVYNALRRDVTKLLQFVRTLEQQVGLDACAQVRVVCQEWCKLLARHPQLPKVYTPRG